ncbi:PREDICTED: gastrin-releasing peptide [Nipponia nippon]|uniref:gastrin-releasing peptide n=1 Tax=Nipponia nippon TaxID=128390 RepID=UPI0005115269|nr:PREDICTED: gastrin-releasing peptide [Nipponia nippon]
MCRSGPQALRGPPGWGRERGLRTSVDPPVTLGHQFLVLVTTFARSKLKGMCEKSDCEEAWASGRGVLAHQPPASPWGAGATFPLRLAAPAAVHSGLPAGWQQERSRQKELQPPDLEGLWAILPRQPPPPALSRPRASGAEPRCRGSSLRPARPPPQHRAPVRAEGAGNAAFPATSDMPVRPLRFLPLPFFTGAGTQAQARRRLGGTQELPSALGCGHTSGSPGPRRGPGALGLEERPPVLSLPLPFPVASFAAQSQLRFHFDDIKAWYIKSASSLAPRKAPEHRLTLQSHPTSRQRKSKTYIFSIRFLLQQILPGHLMGKKSTGDFPYVYEEENKTPFSALPENIKQLEDYLQWEEISKSLLRLLEGNENKSAHFLKGGLPWSARNTWETDDNSSWKDMMDYLLQVVNMKESTPS